MFLNSPPMSQVALAKNMQVQMKLLPTELDETFRLICFDSAKNNECLSSTTKEQLREIVNQINIFRTIDECENLIKEKMADQILLVINSSDIQEVEEIIKRVHDCLQILAIHVIDHVQYKTADISKYRKVIITSSENLISRFATDQKYRQKYQMPGVGIQDRSTNSTIEHFGVLHMLDSLSRRVGYPIPDNHEEFLLTCRKKICRKY